MAGYLVRRLLAAIPILLVTSILAFSIMHLAPGSPIDAMVGTSGSLTEEARAVLEEKYQLDRSFVEQYVSWLGGVVRGDFGTSISQQESVMALIAQRFPRTLLLTLVSMIASTLVATAVGTLAGKYSRSWVDYLVTTGALIGISVPPFVAALALILLFSVKLSVFPSMGYVSLAENPIEGLRHLVLPCLTLSLLITGILIRFVRAEVLSQMQQDYVRTARSKGIKEPKVVYKHVLRNAALPAITVLGLYFARYLAGTIVIEQIFTWPGIGQLAFQATLSRDYPLMQGCILFFGLIYVVINLFVDILYAFVDPRIALD